MAEPLLLLSSSGENFFRFLVALVVFAAILFATYYVTKWTAGYQKNRMSARNFEVIDSVRIGVNKYIMIVRVGRNRYYSVGVGKDELVMLGELLEDEVVLPSSQKTAKSEREAWDFSGLLTSFKQSAKKSEHHEN